MSKLNHPHICTLFDIGQHEGAIFLVMEYLEGKEADARTDIFAFGAVVYEMLTGRKAFEGYTDGRRYLWMAAPNVFGPGAGASCSTAMATR